MKRPTRNLIFDTTPAVTVVVKNHETECECREPRIIDKHPAKGCRCLAHCRCRKHIYIPQLRYREATRFRSWEEAETFARQWAKNHTRANIEAHSIAERLEKLQRATEEAAAKHDAEIAKLRELVKQVVEGTSRLLRIVETHDH